MASIVFNNLRNISKDNERDYTYLDLHCDIEQNKMVTSDSRNNPIGKDIRVSLDEAAIKNSIINIFNTTPGERFLIPEFGINLRKFLFEPLSDDIAQSIGDTILYGLERWEPRIRIEKVLVMARIAGSVIQKGRGQFSSSLESTLSSPSQEDEYVVSIKILMPRLRHRARLEGMLRSSGFAEIQYTFI